MWPWHSDPRNNVPAGICTALGPCPRSLASAADSAAWEACFALGMISARHCGRACVGLSPWLAGVCVGAGEQDEEKPAALGAPPCPTPLSHARTPISVNIQLLNKDSLKRATQCIEIPRFPFMKVLMCSPPPPPPPHPKQRRQLVTASEVLQEGQGYNPNVYNQSYRVPPPPPPQAEHQQRTQQGVSGSRKREGGREGV